MQKFRRIINVIFALILVLILITVLGIEENTTVDTDVYETDISDGWVLADPDGSLSEIAVPYYFPEGKNTLRITRTLPEVEDYTILLIKCNYKSLDAYVDAEQIYFSHPAVFGKVQTDLGHYIAMIPLREEHSGRDITLHLEERESGYNTGIKYIHLTSRAQYGFTQFTESILILILAVVILLSAVACFVTWLIFWISHGIIPKESYHPLLWAGLFAASLGVWVITEPHLWAIASGSFTVSGLLNYVALALMPLAYLGLLFSVAKEEILSLRLVLWAAKILVVVQWLLFFFGVTDYSSMLLMLQGEVVAALAISFFFLFWKRDSFQFGKSIHYGMGVMLVMSVLVISLYMVDENWMPWALNAVMVLWVSVLLHITGNIHQAFRSISETRQYKEFALTDIMTGLKSRYAYTIFEGQYKTGKLPQDLCLVFLDINGLKHANDTLGHLAGDELIIAASECVREAFADGADCFRMGGDEFLIASTAGKADVLERLERFEDILSRWSGTHIASITVSYGLAVAGEHPDMDFEELLRTADHRMYQYKRQCAANQ